MKKLKRIISLVCVCMLVMCLGACSLYDLLNFSVQRLDNPPSIPSGENKYKSEQNAISKSQLQQIIQNTSDYFDGAINDQISFSWSNYLLQINADGFYTTYTQSIYRSVISQSLSNRDDYKPYANFTQSYSNNEFNGYMQAFFDGYFTEYCAIPFSLSRYDYEHDYLQNIGHKEYDIVNSYSLTVQLLQFAHQSPSLIQKDYENGKPLYKIPLPTQLNTISQLLYFDFATINATNLKTAQLEFFLTEDNLCAQSLRLKLEFDNESFIANITSTNEQAELVEPGYSYRFSAYSYKLKQIFPYDNYLLNSINFDYKIHVKMPEEMEGLTEFNFYSTRKTITYYDHYGSIDKGESTSRWYQSKIIYAIEPIGEWARLTYGDMIFKIDDEYSVLKNNQVTKYDYGTTEYYQYSNLFILDLTVFPVSYQQVEYIKDQNTQQINFLSEYETIGITSTYYPDLVFDRFSTIAYNFEIVDDKLTSLIYSEYVQIYAYNDNTPPYLYTSGYGQIEYQISYQFDITIPQHLLEVHYYYT